MIYAGIAIILAVMAAGILMTARRNNEIRTGGIETEAVVTRSEEHISTDNEGSISAVTYTFYVTYRNQYGEEVEARLGSGKSFDNRIGKAWDSELKEGSVVTIKYLPDKPDYVIMA